MSLVIDRDGSPVHFPKRDAFQFDEEVAAIFENMAQRSIPMYSEVHRLHVQMLAEQYFLGKEPVTLFDIGASTGRWFRVMRKLLKVESLKDIASLSCFAFDNSHPMLARLSQEFPEVDARYMDLTQPTHLGARADVVVMLYVLQFIPYEQKIDVLRWVWDHMAPDGVLVLGQKENMGGDDAEFQQEYIRFRLDNGYSKEEIAAKTAALKHSMWCNTPHELRSMLQRACFSKVIETTRWLNFSTYLAYK